MHSKSEHFTITMSQHQNLREGAGIVKLLTCFSTYPYLCPWPWSTGRVRIRVRAHIYVRIGRVVFVGETSEGESVLTQPRSQPITARGSEGAL